MENKSIGYMTDMADERVDEYKKVYNLTDIEGIKVSTSKNNDINITTVDVLNERGSKILKKEVGKYITIELDNIISLTDVEKRNIIDELTKQIKILVGNNLESIMIVGLGNEYVTPDSLGPKVVSKINVTRHIIKYSIDLIEPNTREICAISPGVLGLTGIETEEIIEAIVKRVKPKIVIVVDSLASMNIKRVGKTIQLGNAGITPGAGVGNKRKALNKNTLGVPVIAIGVPTVVDLRYHY